MPTHYGKPSEILPRTMNTRIQIPALLTLVALALAGSAPAATFSSSTTAPTAELSDLANFAAQTGTDKCFFRSANESGVTDAAKGHTNSLSMRY